MWTAWDYLGEAGIGAWSYTGGMPFNRPYPWLLAGAGGIVYVPVAITGENGVVESNADRKWTVTVTGGELLGFGSANPRTEERYDAGSFTTYQGRALAVVRAGESGTVCVTVTDGSRFAAAEIAIR